MSHIQVWVFRKMCWSISIFTRNQYGLKYSERHFPGGKYLVDASYISSEGAPTQY